MRSISTPEVSATAAPAATGLVPHTDLIDAPSLTAAICAEIAGLTDSDARALIVRARIESLVNFIESIQGN